MSWYFEAWKKYAVFSGRARRKEYWTFYLINTAITSLLGVLMVYLRSKESPPNGADALATVLYYGFILAILLPNIAVTVRRLHDTGRSGWWLLISLVPLIGVIVLVVFLLEDSQPNENQYGPNPKGGEVLSRSV